MVHKVAWRGVALKYLLVRPDFVSPHIGRVEVLLALVEDHAVDGGVVLIGVVLDVFFQTTLVVDGEDIAIAGKVVERVAIDVVRRLIGCEHEDGTGLGVGVVGFGMTSHGM
jgi:hypothetical protein